MTAPTSTSSWPAARARQAFPPAHERVNIQRGKPALALVLALTVALTLGLAPGLAPSLAPTLTLGLGRGLDLPLGTGIAISLGGLYR